MGLELIVALVLLLLAGYIIFKFIKKIVVALFTLVMVICLIIVGFGVLLYKDIQTYREHETKAILLVITDESGEQVRAAAAFEPEKQVGSETAAVGNDQDENAGQKEFRLFSKKEVKQINTLFREKNTEKLLKEYFKIAIFRPSSIVTILSGDAVIFDMRFSADEIKTILNSDDPQALLIKKSIREKNLKLRNLLKMFSSDAEIKGSLFFGALFDQMRKDELLAVVGLIKSYHRNEISILQETLVFRLIKVSPINVARKLIQTVSQAFGEGKIKVPRFGAQKPVDAGGNQEL